MNGAFFGTIVQNGTITPVSFLLATACSLALGFFLGVIYKKYNHCSASLLITLVLLPAIVQLVIMMVNGNIGAGVAVAGAFSLVRFRSVAGRGQEIAIIFLAMAVGLATGMGYLGLAVVFAVILMIVYVIMRQFHVGEVEADRELRITIPEDLDYEGVFDPVLQKYTTDYELIQVKTMKMGSFYRLKYAVRIKRGISLKEFMDEIRIRNGNLEVSCGREASKHEEL